MNSADMTGCHHMLGVGISYVRDMLGSLVIVVGVIVITYNYEHTP